MSPQGRVVVLRFLREARGKRTLITFSTTSSASYASYVTVGKGDEKQPGKGHHLALVLHSKRGARVSRLFSAVAIRNFKPYQGANMCEKCKVFGKCYLNS